MTDNCHAVLALVSKDKLRSDELTFATPRTLRNYPALLLSALSCRFQLRKGGKREINFHPLAAIACGPQLFFFLFAFLLLRDEIKDYFPSQLPYDADWGEIKTQTSLFSCMKTLSRGVAPCFTRHLRVFLVEKLSELLRRV